MSLTAHVFTTSTLPLIGQKLHELLTAKGWEIQHANTAAIGTGTASNPKWDGQTATASTSGGLASYLMPLAGLTNRWVVQFDLRWGGTTTNLVVNTTTAQAVNTGTGALTAAGRTNGGGVGGFGAELWLNASEYGVCIGGTGNWHGVERRRLTGNTYVDHLTTHQFATQTLTGFITGARNITRSWATGEFAEQPLAFLTGMSSTSATGGVDISTMSSSDNNVGYPVGPFGTSNGLGGVLRHVQCWRPGDSVAGVDQAIEIDGQGRLYYATNTTGPGNTRVLVARE